MPLVICNIFEGMVESIILGIFIVILFHWIEFYYITLKTLKKEEMLKKINSRYSGTDITPDTIISKAKFALRFKLPLGIVILTEIVLQFTMDIVDGKN